MTSHSETQFLPYTTEQLFDLVADIESYPQFLPWCRAARIIERKPDEMLAELILSFAHMTERYTSRVALQRPLSKDAAGAIDVMLVKGPFKYLTNRWRFTPEAGGARIDFFIDFQFQSKLLEALIGGAPQKPLVVSRS